MVWNVSTATTITGMNTYAEHAEDAALNVLTQTVLKQFTVTIAVPALGKPYFVRNVIPVRNVMSTMDGTVLAAMNALQTARKSCAVFVGSVVTAWADCVMTVDSAKDASN